ncbi:MAG TPA: hypothetical protein VFD82_15400 [Planctomycetota bacterium]|nr:hypothetical protein [Planctomycetota bacterium]
METFARGSLPFLLLAAAAFAQTPDETEPPPYEGDPWERIERDEKLLDLTWRRNADGDFEWSCAGAKGAKWKPMFGDSLRGAMGVGSYASYVVPLLHNGDLLSLTHGEQHLRRLGRAVDLETLVAFARAPLGAAASRIDEMDRLVAVDVLRSRDDEACKRALAQLAGDAGAPAVVRTRAAAAPVVRERLRPEELLLPERSDLVVVIDHGRLFDAHALLGLARFTGLVSSARVLDMLKRPLVDDAAIGQAESDSTLELPFELVRRLGGIRFDHSCVSVCWTAAIGGELTWTAAVAGGFEPSRIAQGLSPDGFEIRVGDGRHEVSWEGGHGELADRRVTACATGVDVAPRAALADHLLRDGSYSVRLHAPAGSKVLAVMTLGGIANVTTYDLQVTWGDPLLVEETFTMKDEAAAAAMPEKVGSLLERIAEQNGQGELFAKLGPRDLAVAKNVVTTTHRTPLAQLLPELPVVRNSVIEQWRKRR